MIIIKEDTPIKLSGITSLFISFPFDQAVINVIKTADKYIYHKPNHTWELPANSLAYLLDNLTYIDDITLELKQEDNNVIHRIPILKHKYPPFKHQQEGIEYGLNNDNWLLLDSPGMGKTLQMIYLAEELKKQAGIAHCLIICGINTLKSNWKKEIEKYSTESCRILGEKINSKGKVTYASIKERAAELMEPLDSFFIITNIETIRNDDIVQALKTTKNKIDMVVLDEAHKCFDFNTLIDTNLGKLAIGDIVNKELNCLVKSYNIKNNQIEYKEIESWSKLKSDSKSMLELTILDDTNKQHILKCSSDHLIYTKNRGYVKADDLTEADILIIIKQDVEKGKIIQGRLIKKRAIGSYDEKYIYDIGIKDNNNFFADNILVHNCKSSQSQQGHNLLKLTDYKYKIALTGTLIMNKPIDAYSALKWIGVEKANLTNFKSQYCVFGGFGGHQIIGFKNLDLLKDEISSCSLRRKLEDVKDFPKKSVVNEIIDMEDSHKKFYESVQSGIKEECDKINLDANNVLALTTRLRQATSCPSILTSSNITSSKLERALELIEEIVENGNKVVVMSTFKEPVNLMYNILTEKNVYFPLIGTGDISDDIVSKNVDLFQTDPKYKVFLGTTAKCGTGITLNAAAYMICIDTPWTSALQEQVEDRINRMTNTKPALIYRLICKGTIDEIVANIIEVKQAFSDFMVDDSADANAISILRNYIQDL